LTLSLTNASALVNFVVDEQFSAQLLQSLSTMFQMMTSQEFVQALAAKVRLGKPTQTSITKRLMQIPGFTVKGFASLVGSELPDQVSFPIHE
jgi:environmental stress-induced protein Ves